MSAGGVGESSVRFDAASKVTGAATYPADRVPPDALHAVVVFTNQPHARLVALDVSAAEATEGVVAVVTAADVPVNEYGLTMFDQPVLIGVDHTGRSDVPCDVSRWEADHLAVVVAETRAAADAGAAAIRAEWDELPLAPDVESARTDEVLVHDGRVPSNVYYELPIRKGDIEAGWAAADVIVEGTYGLPHQEHAYLQVEAATGWVDDEGRITVETSGQWTHEDREQIAHALDVPDDRVRVIYAAIGGAFGGKEDMSLQIVIALAVRKLRSLGIDRPVHCSWSREESIVGHHKRHRAVIEARLGATNDGRITAVEADVWLDAGAYNYTSNKVLGNAHLSVAGAYVVPNARINSRAVYTTSVPGGAFRGFGGPQGAFVAETQMNKLAAILDMDPIELRRRNMLREGDIGITQVPLPAGVGLPDVIEACAARAPSDGPPVEAAPLRSVASLPAPGTAIRRGRGFAVGMKNVGFSFGFPERCEAEVHFHGDAEDERPATVDVFHGGAEVGQGNHQAILQMTADASGVDLEQVRGHFSDTATSGDAGSASASRLTFMAGNSVLGAVEEAEKAWQDGERPAVGRFRYTPPPTETLDPVTGEGQPNFSYGYMAMSADVSVDTGTGHIRVDRVVSAHDVGRVINPALLRGQIEGAVVQAHGYVISENLVVTDGRIRNPRLSQYLIPGIGDIPTEVEAVILELGDPVGPWGARGVAEMPYITYAPAVIAAVHDATGVWFDTFPLTPSRVLAALRP
ncbi:MAG: xanthine dehydrogenase family protein molybdopterin-binding subunit [Acidimicrobiales bacterium]|nr:xanthine dehydrogenase family protein molybdopterin-binding subunit [Acidimicrobiales bacterium]